MKANIANIDIMIDIARFVKTPLYNAFAKLVGDVIIYIMNNLFEIYINGKRNILFSEKN